MNLKCTAYALSSCDTGIECNTIPRTHLVRRKRLYPCMRCVVITVPITADGSGDGRSVLRYDSLPFHSRATFSYEIIDRVVCLKCQQTSLNCICICARFSS